MDTVDAALQCPYPDGRYAYISPFYTQSKTVAWDYLKEFTRPILARSPHESELRVDLLNGARISLFGGDNYDRLRGIWLDGAILDEYADMPPPLFPQVIRPALADRRGWAVIIGTVKGRNQLWQMYEEHLRDPEWFTLILKASETGILSQDELEAAQRLMTVEQYAAEFECDPSAAILGAYYGKEIAQAEREGRICDVPVDPHLPVHTAWDLGIGDPMAIWFFQVHAQSVRVVDYYENYGFAIPHYVGVIEAKGYPQGIDFVPHDARVRDISTGRTRIETLLSLNRRPDLAVE